MRISLSVTKIWIHEAISAIKCDKRIWQIAMKRTDWKKAGATGVVSFLSWWGKSLIKESQDLAANIKASISWAFMTLNELGNCVSLFIGPNSGLLVEQSKMVSSIVLLYFLGQVKKWKFSFLTMPTGRHAGACKPVFCIMKRNSLAPHKARHWNSFFSQFAIKNDSTNNRFFFNPYPYISADFLPRWYPKPNVEEDWKIGNGVKRKIWSYNRNYKGNINSWLLFKKKNTSSDNVLVHLDKKVTIGFWFSD